MFAAASAGIPSFGDAAWKEPVRNATAAALPANTYSAGVLTANANGAIPAIDGNTVILGGRYLVKDEATTSNQGIYVATNLGSAGSRWTLTRATDCDSASEMVEGLTVYVAHGVSLAHRLFLASTSWTPTSGDPAWRMLSVTFSTDADIANSGMSNAPALNGSNTWSGDNVYSGGRQRWLGSLAPAQITSQRDDYAPTGWNATVNRLSLTTDAARTVTGLSATAATEGDMVLLLLLSNAVGALTLANESASSSANNRFRTLGNANLVIQPGGMVMLVYASLRWRVLSA